MTKLTEELKKYLESLKKTEEELWDELSECKDTLGSSNPSTRIARARWGECFEHYTKLRELVELFGDHE